VEIIGRVRGKWLAAPLSHLGVVLKRSLSGHFRSRASGTDALASVHRSDRQKTHDDS